MDRNALRREQSLWRWALGLTPLVLASLAACSDDGSPEGPPRDPTAGPRSVLIVSFDTTRADALGCYGGDEGCSPTIDALAAEGVVFEHAFSPTPMTLPSHTTLLTGLDPPRHRVRDNSVYEVPEEARTLAEELAEAGYHSIGVVAAIVLEHRYRLGQGFDVYDCEGLEATADRTRAERSATEVTDAFLRHLDAAPEGPWLGFVHYYDPHQPFQAPQEYVERYGDDPRDLYFGEIAYADDQLARIVARLKERGEYENTLIVITADHGEGRGEHGEVTHSKLVHDATQRVPLILRHHSLAPRRVDQQLVNLADVMPTVLEWIGVDSEQGLDGRSLLAVARGEPADWTGDAYLETLSPSLAYDFAPIDAVRNLEWKLVWGATPRLFDLKADPAEDVNVADQHPEQVKELHARLQMLRSRGPSLDTASRDVSGAERAALGSIGYATATSEEAAAEDDRSHLPDPYDHLARLDEYERATQLIRTQQPASLREALRLLQGLVRDFPGSYQFRESLGGVHGRFGQHDQALEQFREAEKIHPDSVDLWMNIAIASFSTGDRETSKHYLLRMIEHEDSPPRASLMLAELYMRQGNALGAKGVLQELLKRDDLSPVERRQALEALR